MPTIQYTPLPPAQQVLNELCERICRKVPENWRRRKALYLAYRNLLGMSPWDALAAVNERLPIYGR